MNKWRLEKATIWKHMQIKIPGVQISYRYLPQTAILTFFKVTFLAKLQLSDWNYFLQRQIRKTLDKSFTDLNVADGEIVFFTSTENFDHLLKFFECCKNAEKKIISSAQEKGERLIWFFFLLWRQTELFAPKLNRFIHPRQKGVTNCLTDNPFDG